MVRLGTPSLRCALWLVLALFVAGCGDDLNLDEVAGAYELDTEELAHEQWLRAVHERERELADLALPERQERLARWRTEIRDRVAGLRLRVELGADGTFQTLWMNGTLAGRQSGTWHREPGAVVLSTQSAQGAAFEGARLARAQVADQGLRFVGEGVPVPFLLRPAPPARNGGR